MWGWRGRETLERALVGLKTPQVGERRAEEGQPVGSKCNRFVKALAQGAAHATGSNF